MRDDPPSRDEAARRQEVVVLVERFGLREARLKAGVTANRNSLFGPRALR